MNKKNRMAMNLKSISVALFVSCLALSGVLDARDRDKEDYRNPLGCKDVGYRFELKVLDLFPAEAGERNSLYFILNKLDKPIQLHQMRSLESTRSIFLNHVIHPKRWAVLSTCEQELKYICTVADGQSKYGKVVNCADSIQICEFARVKFGLNNRGNHWIVNSNTRNGAVREVVRYGIIPQ